MSSSANRLSTKSVREAFLDTACAKPAERPLPPMQSNNLVPAALVAARASSISSFRGRRSCADSRPDGCTSREKRMSCVTVLEMSTQFAPS